MGGKLLLSFSLFSACAGPACGPVPSPGSASRLPVASKWAAGPPSQVAPPSAVVSEEFRGDIARSGRVQNRGPAHAPSPAWSYPTGGPVYSSPVVDDAGAIYFASLDGAVYALTPQGELRWRFVTHDAVWSSPAVSGETVYVGSGDDTLYALSAESGEVRFARRLGDCVEPTGRGPEGARCDVDGPPAVAPDGTVWVGANGVYAIGPDGQVKVSVATAHVFGGPAIAPDGRVYFGAQDDRLRAIAPDGSLIWEFRTGDDVDSTPAVLPDGGVVFGSDDDRLYALRPDGTLRFSLMTRGDVRSSPALAEDGTIYVGSFDGVLYAVAPDGTLKFSYRTGGRILSSPVIDADGNLYFGSQDDAVHSVGPDGKERWTLHLGGDVDSTPAIAADGTLYVGCDDGSLHALR
jgi:outer membrane protein assembly factor BamB